MLYSDAETVRVRIEPEFREHQPTWIAWTYGYPSSTVEMAKYCQPVIVGRATRAMIHGSIHYQSAVPH
jgi:hypothetical protein